VRPGLGMARAGDGQGWGWPGLGMARAGDGQGGSDRGYGVEVVAGRNGMSAAVLEISVRPVARNRRANVY
jgi:hypothetical protein